MGFFSWNTIIKGESISNKYSKRGPLPVVLLVPKEFGGQNLVERNYLGYGVFANRDAYALLAQWNCPEKCRENDDFDRLVGLSITCLEQDRQNLKYPLKFVSLDYYKRTDCKYEDFETCSIDCPHQGYSYDTDEDDDY